ncbi:MAG: hypothetical protein ACRET1_00685 [Burkholderiales bacterium]|jgi:hypothetical protein
MQLNTSVSKAVLAMLVSGSFAIASGAAMAGSLGNNSGATNQGKPTPQQCKQDPSTPGCPK